MNLNITSRKTDIGAVFYRIFESFAKFKAGISLLVKLQARGLQPYEIRDSTTGVFLLIFLYF